ncbi:MAG: translation elongation factor Ts [Planctomycetes bacterium]|nr:translation elongation factor Ts [Planctomycetota bacterium]
MAVTVAQIKELRDRTGCGMMDAKRALTEYDGDVDKAIEELRKKGELKAEKRSGRETAEGKIGIAISDDRKTAAIVEIKCETDFTGGNDEFLGMVDNIAKSILANEGEATELAYAGGEGTVAAAITAMVAKTGENMSLGAWNRMTVDNGYIGSYMHSDGKQGAIVKLEGAACDSDELKALGKDLGMHAAAMEPLALDESGVDADLVAKEKEIAAEQARATGKPENIIEKIAEGKIKAFFKDKTFLAQPFVKDGSLNVEKYIASVNSALKLTDYVRVKVGG